MGLKIGSIYGIPIILDYSWFLIFILVVWTVGFLSAPFIFPGLSTTSYLIIGIFSSVLLFASVLLHELAHSVVAKRNGLKIRQITLFLFGGVSEMETEPANPSLELRMAAAGPLTSVGLTFVAGAGWFFAASTGLSPSVVAPLEYAAEVNGIVAVFNLIPAFPLDGGRIFRAFLWGRNKDMLKATRTASLVGRGFAYAMMIAGVAIAATVDIFTGLWLILIGWFISSGAQSAMSQTVIQEDLSGMSASDLMTRHVDHVPPEMKLDVLSQEFARLKHNGFPVVSIGELVGCVTQADLRKVKSENWETIEVRSIMTPRDKLVTIREDDIATRALSLLGTNSIGRLFVLNDHGQLTGIITRSDVVETIRVREGVLGTDKWRAGSGSSGGRATSFTVTRGMLFVVEQVQTEGGDWNASYGNTDFKLVKVEATALKGALVKRFTFEALRTGRLPMTLNMTATGGSGRTQSIMKAVRYDILVEP